MKRRRAPKILSLNVCVIAVEDIPWGGCRMFHYVICYGPPPWIHQTLVKHYNTRTKARKLLRGNITRLGPTLKTTEFSTQEVQTLAHFNANEYIQREVLAYGGGNLLRFEIGTGWVASTWLDQEPWSVDGEIPLWNRAKCVAVLKRHHGVDVRG